jgi:hypothetical protein
LSEDPIHFHAGTNFNNPALLFDPMGTCPASPQTPKQKPNVPLLACKNLALVLFLKDAGEGYETIVDPWIAAGFYGAISLEYYLNIRRCIKQFGSFGS